HAVNGLFGVSLNGKVRKVMSTFDFVDVHDIAADGTMLVEMEPYQRGILFWRNGASQERDLSWLDESELNDISPDGSQIVFEETGQGGGPRKGVYIRNTDGSPAVRLGDGEAGPLSPDGKFVISRTTVKPAHLVILPTGP